MELKEISIYEARSNDLPANEPWGEGQICQWYALEDEGEYKGFMEITRDEEEDINEISYFMIPDIYQGEGLGHLMLERYLNIYVPDSKPDSLLAAVFNYSGDYGEEFSRLFSDSGFDISIDTYKEIAVPFDKAYEKLFSGTEVTKESGFMNLAQGLEIAAGGVIEDENSTITVQDLNEADHELSVMKIDDDGNLEAVLLVSVPVDRREVTVTDMYISSSNRKMLGEILSFAVQNAAHCDEVPQMISFVAANEKLEMLLQDMLDEPRSSDILIAEAEFNLGKYAEQVRILTSPEILHKKRAAVSANM